MFNYSYSKVCYETTTWLFFPQKASLELNEIPLQAHLSFDFGCRLAKVEDKLISPDAEYTMNVDELEHEIMVDRLESSLLPSVLFQHAGVIV